jgi:polar amino acid transport system substrate-binding protein
MTSDPNRAPAHKGVSMRRITVKANRRSTSLVLAAGLILGTAACASDATESSETSASDKSEIAGVELVSPGEITFCADISAPPMTFYNSEQEAVGAEIDLGGALAEELGLESEWNNVAFAGIIPALQTKRCDAILGELYIKPEREEIFDFVPYMNSGNAILVAAGNPQDLDGLNDLCGATVAAQTGTTVAGYLKEASAECETSGNAPIDTRLFGKDSEAQQQLKIGLVDAYGTTVTTAAYAMKQQPGKFEVAGEAFGKIRTGIATNKQDKALHDALADAFATVRADGTYDAILEDWELQAAALEESGSTDGSDSEG